MKDSSLAFFQKSSVNDLLGHRLYLQFFLQFIDMCRYVIGATSATKTNCSTLSNHMLIHVIKL